MARCFVGVFFSILLLVCHVSCAPDVHRGVKRDSFSLETRACSTSENHFQNAGFETGKLKPWTFGRTNHSLPVTAEVVDHGYKSHHAVEFHAVVPPSHSPNENTGRLNQTIRICNPGDDSKFRVSWWLYQVPGATQAEDFGLESPEFSVFMIEHGNGYANFLGDFQLYKTYLTCSFCAGTRHYAAGTWHNFYGTFYPDYTSDLMTLEFRLYVSADGGDKQALETKIQVDEVEIKKV